MKPVQYQLAQQLFLQACDLTREQRHEFLNENCDDPSIRNVVENMLSADEETGDLLPRNLDQMVEEIANNSIDFGIFEPSIRLRCPEDEAENGPPYRLLTCRGARAFAATQLKERSLAEVWERY